MKRLDLPREDNKDVAELPGYIQEAFEIYYVGAVGEVIAMTLEDKG